MRLSLQTDYALRALMLAGARRERMTVDEIAAFYGIPASHVAKAVNRLVRLGYLNGFRGVGGGVELALPPAEVRLGELIRRFEGNIRLLDCVGVEDVCAIQPYCKLKNVLAEAERVQLSYLDSVTLADVLPSPKAGPRGGPIPVPDPPKRTRTTI
jgi:Rrf2 family nitric oxide-sensitive transcriptional repressor